MEEETITEFNTRVRDLSNKFAPLRNPIEEQRLASKILRSLPQRFAIKVTAVEEMQDITKMKLDELVGSLRTYEMYLPEDVQPKRSKGFVLQADLSEEKGAPDDIIKHLAMMAPNFDSLVRKLKIKGTSQGFRHIQAECANTLKKKKSLTANLSNNESEDDEEDDESNNFVALLSILVDDSEKSDRQYSSVDSDHSANDSTNSDDEEITDECLAETYKKLYQ
ncbi:unnamed protein product [Rhodiola kirilowii]